ncbi:MAG: DUF378 domain-containing protein [Gemmatimonadota bacterium]|nr:DUF378 domain-containing protein [Gemmatimonadota bacterium]
MKAIDILAATLLVIGGLNWGLVGLFGFDLVAALLGTMTPLARAVYALVGLAALYPATALPVIQRRWGVAGARA